MTLGDAAAKIRKTPSQLEEWEKGDSFPTIKQAEKLAMIYRRPFAIFFLPEVPKDFYPLQDFRKSDSQPLSTASVFIIREIQQRQGWLKEVLKEVNEQPLPFIGKFSISDSPQEVAHDIVKTLGVQDRFAQRSPLKYWTLKAEKAGIFVSRTSNIHSRLVLDKDELQGFAIADPHAPFIFVNSQDWDAPQLFTLVHELAHLWIAATGLSNDISIENSSRVPIERFCNEVSANVLMPKTSMLDLGQSVFQDAKSVYKAARAMGVSSLALIVRASNLGVISAQKYKSLKKEADHEFKLFLEKEDLKKQKAKQQEGGPNPYLLRVNKNSRLFTQFVLDEYRGGRIEPTEASALLNTPVNKFSKLETQIFQ